MNCTAAFLSRLFFCSILCCPGWLYGQLATTWSLDPHAGLHAGFLQPAATAVTPYAWELNLGSVNTFLGNDFVFARQTSGLRLVRAFLGAENATVDDPNRTFSLNGQTFRYEYPAGDRRFYVRTGVDILGPAISFRVGPTTRVGLFTRARILANASNVDADLNYTPYFNTPIGVAIPVDPLRAGGAAWGEVGLQLAHAFLLDNDAEVRLGSNLRYLIPVEGINAYSSEGGGVRRVPGDSLVVFNLEANLGLTNGFQGNDDEALVAGQGFAADLGVQYAWESLADGSYRYTVGLSLLDVGQLNFTGARNYRFINAEEVLLDGADYDFSEDGTLVAALDQLAQDVNGNIAASEVATTLPMGLPANISLQFAYRPAVAWQLSAVYRGDLPGGTSGLNQGQAFTLAAHYSQWWYGAGLSAGLTDWRQLQIGAQLRLGPLYLGTDRLLGTILPRAQLGEADFFLGLRLHDFGGEGGRRGRHRRGKLGKRGQVKCYTF